LVHTERMRAVIAGVQLTETTPRRFWHKLWGKKLTMVFQHADEALNMHSSVGETLAQLPVPGGATDEKIVQHLCELFDRESVGSLLRKKIWMLSGGQKQRLNLVRGLMLGTDVIFLDEPLNGLDYESATRVVSVIQRKLSEGKGILVISHNEEIFNALVREKDQYYLHASQAGNWALPIDRRID
jgi:ABC-type multidrug transport system ATPase subunit